MKFKVKVEKKKCKSYQLHSERNKLTKRKVYFPCHAAPLSYCLATNKMPLIFRQETETARKLHTKLVSLQVSCRAHWCMETWPLMKKFAFICRHGCVDISPDSGTVISLSQKKFAHESHIRIT